jgi:SEC-C motif-containing protein
MNKQLFCPCGSGEKYQLCCEVYHLDHSKVTHPEQLMRSRYSAHVLKLNDYVIKTYHPSCNAESQREAIAESINLKWVKLQVTNSQFTKSELQGFVTFNAFYLDNGQVSALGEISRFVVEDGLWFYIDGEFVEVSMNKLKRNDPCICGSGKKFKKCCG